MDGFKSTTYGSTINMHLFMSILCLTSLRVYGARILLVAPSMQFSSHRMEVKIVGDELASRGHEVYITTATLTPHDSRIYHPKSSNISELQYHITEKDVATVRSLEEDVFGNIKTVRHNPIFSTDRLVRIMCEDAQFALSDKEFLSRAKQLHFEYAVVDRFFIGPCFFLIAQAINVPYFSIGSPYEYWLGGTPPLPSVYTSLMPIFFDKRSFTYRLLQELSWLGFDFVSVCKADPANWYFSEMLRKHAPGLGNFRYLANQSLINFVTRDSVLHSPQPTMPNVVAVPSLTYVEPSDVLSPVFDKIMTSAAASQHGVIVVSFGSMAKYLPADVIDKFAVAFEELGRLNYIIIWNLKRAMYDVKPAPNVYLLDWLPQNDLLGHRNTKLFITHCGNNGHYEAVYHRVPMVALPLFGDQPPNAYYMENNGFGKSLDVSTFTSDELVTTVESVVTDLSIRQRISKASAILRDRPMTPRQTVAYWIEHVIKHGHQHLRSHAMELAWYEYFMVDIICLLSIAFVTALCGSYLAVKLCWSCLKRLFHI